jgi:hypothetical protein
MKVHDGTYFEDQNILSTWNAIVDYINNEVIQLFPFEQ